MKQIISLFLISLLSMAAGNVFAVETDSLTLKEGEKKYLKAPDTPDENYPSLSLNTKWTWSGPIEITNDSRPSGIVIQATGTGVASVACSAWYWDTNVIDHPDKGYKIVWKYWTIICEEGTILVQSIKLNQSAETLTAGGNNLQLSVTEILPSDATDKTVTWSSDNDNVASVDARTGLVTPAYAGTATISCTANDGSGVRAECVVTVNPGNSKNFIAGDVITRNVEGVDMKFNVMQSNDYAADDFYGNAWVHGANETNVAIPTKTSGRIVIPDIIPDTKGCTIKWIYNPNGAYEMSPKLEGLKVVGIMQYAFYGCDNITSVEIPASVKSISFASFGGCTSLTEVRVLSPNPPVVRRSAFPSEIYQNATLHVLSGTKDAYANSDWSNYFQNIEELGENTGEDKPKDGDKSDVNGDGKVDVADIASVISAMANSSTDAQADVNGDGKVDVADIASVISKMAQP